MPSIRVKICGITHVDDARVAIEAGADLLGFILYPKSPRYVAPVKVAEILKEISDWRLNLGAQRTANLQSPASSLHVSAFNPPKTVGVFVNEPVERILAILDQTGLDFVQLHSEEGPEVLMRLAGRAFKALRPTSADEALAQAAIYASLGPPDGPTLMVDAHDPNAYGGTGKTADWQAAAALARRHAGLLLAGGLTADNVAAAIEIVQPWGVDVSSGVEAAPGKKDHSKVRAFVAAVKAAS